jgi:hypothetical protein
LLDKWIIGLEGRSDGGFDPVKFPLDWSRQFG